MSTPLSGSARSPLHVRYFTEFLPALVGRLLIEDLRDLTSDFEIAVTDASEPAWRLGIEAGRLVRVGHAGPTPRCRFSLDAATLADVVAARRTPADAFFDRRIELDGDVELGLELSTVLEPFFRRFPFHG